MRLLTAADLSTALPTERAMAAMQRAFIAISAGRVQAPERQSLALGSGTGLLMGAAGTGIGMVAKLVSVIGENAGRGLPGTLGSLLLVDDQTGIPLALMDGTALTALRTAAAAGCATALLARPDAQRATLFGCGTQAATQLLALDAARGLEEIRVVGRDPARLEAFVERHAGRVRADLVTGDGVQDAVRGADIIVAATNSAEPLFDARRIVPGCHVSSIGSFRRDMREIDPALAGRASVFVESRQAATAEAGELIAASEAGLTRARDWTEVGEVLQDSRPGRRAAREITWFKSVGHPAFDLYAARAAYDAAEEAGLGDGWNPEA